MKESVQSKTFLEIVEAAKVHPYHIYKQLKVPCAAKRCYCRIMAFERLMHAAKMLPSGYRFGIYDAWRPLKVQVFLYEKYSQIIANNNPALNSEELNRLIGLFVSYPSDDVKNPPPHASGGAFDLTIIDGAGNPLDMGCGFDELSEIAQTDYYDNYDNDSTGKDEIYSKNRRLLLDIMRSAGFENIPSEWWHFEYGTNFWAQKNNTFPIFDGVFTEKQVRRLINLP